MWKFNATDLLYIFIEVPRKALESYKGSKKWSWKRIEPTKDKKSD